MPQRTKIQMVISALEYLGCVCEVHYTAGQPELHWCYKGRWHVTAGSYDKMANDVIDWISDRSGDGEKGGQIEFAGDEAWEKFQQGLWEQSEGESFPPEEWLGDVS